MNKKMSSENIQLVAFNIILHSGNAKTKIYEAFKAMREANFDYANTLLEDANQEILEAHKSQTQLLQFYANGTKIDMEIIMVHAQDHLMTTMAMREISLEISYLYRKNHELLATLRG
ncbi:PTS cellobiose transporter subunit IIA [Gilliamella sp. Choc4-2]|jgi:cellobiose PTS system EIIA component|uniref:PTS cellobiose transporter subunit IIA n=1 Tax=unclassified Gilliamella TaxID=2685620 RepID=UPI00080E10E7|nr:PTS cellobiose transporter subunit IIA [Gilliamella apicola]OCG31077.1 PTS cellobiose transporter subunit IIA [Gilliamella apicola]OCG46694.1 PTS cellobiose transporter subunit IIA [Gilliamella apicola]OCG56454.1 PTS cellobiose transporter subunit IIA [Gilliamella apicola]